MNKYNTLYGDLLSPVERSQFAKLVKEIQSDTYCKGFTALCEPGGAPSRSSGGSASRSCGKTHGSKWRRCPSCRRGSRGTSSNRDPFF